ncbi:Cytosolic copper metallochaperone, variant 2 [Entomophthora muscae]|uniref:Cytosolic copper metallochaperone, variant 2 n=3 Tax=Entomophthora muscae TaxID=34485 RepID=A0ACC2SF47_9FUNG|nr:Cytosolic copper metallochaperone, variant 2 [Entomophthora muscae]
MGLLSNNLLQSQNHKTIMQTYTYNVKMTCGGCSGAVTKALSKMEGIDNVEIDMEKQLVAVSTSSVSKEDIFEAIKKTGKEVSPA